MRFWPWKKKQLHYYIRGERIWYRGTWEEWRPATVIENGYNPRIVEDRWCHSTFTSNEEFVSWRSICLMTSTEQSHNPVPDIVRQKLEMILIPSCIELEIKRMIEHGSLDEVSSLITEVSNTFCGGKKNE
jgi:hypothetical protein